MKKKILGSSFASLFFIGHLYIVISLPALPFTFFLRWIYSCHEIIVIGNGRFVYFPAKPGFIITYV